QERAVSRGASRRTGGYAGARQLLPHGHARSAAAHRGGEDGELRGLAREQRARAGRSCPCRSARRRCGIMPAQGVREREVGRTVLRAALAETGGGALPGEGFAEQLDAEITGDQERALVLEVDLRAEALLVLGIVDPAGLPGVVGCPVQVAEDLGAADGTA